MIRRLISSQIVSFANYEKRQFAVSSQSHIRSETETEKQGFETSREACFLELSQMGYETKPAPPVCHQRGGEGRQGYFSSGCSLSNRSQHSFLSQKCLQDEKEHPGISSHSFQKGFSAYSTP